MSTVATIVESSLINDDSSSESVRRVGRRFPRLGLRARATVAFAAGALLTSVLLASITYQVARQQFVASRRRVAVAQAQRSGLSVELGLRNSLSSTAVLLSLPTRDSLFDVDVVVVSDNDRDCFRVSPKQRSPCNANTTMTSTRPGAPELGLRRLVAQGSTGYVIDRINSIPYVITGVPIRNDLGGVVAGYYERTPLKAEENNLRQLGRALALAATIATLLGAIFGRIVSIRIMKPLRQVAGAAREIASGRLDTRIATSADTDLDPLVGSFNDMAESLQQRLEREARFASDVSHELRTPLTSLSAAVQLLGARRDEMSDRSQTALDVLTSQTDYFQQLVLDLLEISRFDAGAAQLNMTDFDLVEMTRRVATSFDEVNVRSDGLVPSIVHLDKRRIERILVNLLQNAANYGDGATLVTLDSIPSDPEPNAATAHGVRTIRIMVDDKGPGVDEAERRLIFERFRRGAAQRTGPTKGTGLGLALVSEHARLHRGTASVTVAPSNGARFIVTLTEGDSDQQTLDRASRGDVS
jgi:two-component system, OmpR family, sensor histidine kinase MtrB